MATLALACACVPAAAVLAGCGGGSRQDAAEANARFPMKVVGASFPAKQAVARPATLEVSVKNASRRTVGNVAITIDSFLYTSNYPELAENKRPIWVIERGPGAIAKPPVQSVEVSQPGSGQTAYVNTWALGALAPRATRTFAWRVVPVKPGDYTVHYTVAAGLAGKSKAILTSGGPTVGKFEVHIAGKPPQVHVNPKTGKLAPGPYPGNP